jgi:transcriptional regulator with XRE-family HTH domain
MSDTRQPGNRLKAYRTGRGWTQAELAGRAGVSRAAVSAIEVNRLVPSVAAALALAAALGCTVEELFGSPGPAEADPVWAFPPASLPCRYWEARVGGRPVLFPVEGTPSGAPAHDGIFDGERLTRRSETDPEATLVLACCDPAAGLLATQVARASGVRVLVLPRSSRQALNLLGQGLVHVAGVHLAGAGRGEDNADAVPPGTEPARAGTCARCRGPPGGRRPR